MQSPADGTERRSELVRRILGIQDCPETEVARAAALLEEISRPAGSVIASQASSEERTFILVDGVCDATLGSESLGVLRSGDAFGSIPLLRRSCQPVTVTARTRVTLLILEPRNFVGLFTEAPSIAFRFLRRANHWLRVAGLGQASVSSTTREAR